MAKRTREEKSLGRGRHPEVGSELEDSPDENKDEDKKNEEASDW